MGGVRARDVAVRLYFSPAALYTYIFVLFLNLLLLAGVLGVLPKWMVGRPNESSLEGLEALLTALLV